MTSVLRPEPASLPTETWSDWSCLVRLVVDDETALAPATVQLQTLMGRVERAASRFLEDSELSRANANAGRPVAVSRLLVRLVGTALAAARSSQGAVDPTLGRDLVRCGYDRDITELIDADRAAAPESLTAPPTPSPGWRAVRLDAARGLLTVPAGTALDLGATAKAQTADWAARSIADAYGCSVLVELGGDLAVAGPKHDWQVDVAERVGVDSQQISLHSGGLATSTTAVRTWSSGGARQHHIIDPATGRPADGPWRTVTVAAADAVRANTCSTAAIVLGTAALPWLAERGVTARLVDRDGQVSTVGGWPC